MCKIVEDTQRAIPIGKFVIGRTFTVTAFKYFTPFTAHLKTVYSPIRSSCFSSKLNVLDIIIGPINIHVCKKRFKYYTT